jgi:chemotaxis protein CheD
MKRDISIRVGDLYGSREPAVIHTILGSCVAVCLYDPVQRIGGMNHILLPGNADTKYFDASARYGIHAMELLINRIMTLGGNRHQLIAKAFGGAHILPSITPENGTGRRNIEFVREFLKTEAISMVSYDLGGHQARRIFFHTDTGEVLVKRIFRPKHHGISIKERKLLDLVRREAESPGSITLFSQE